MICNKCVHYPVCKHVKVTADFEQKLKEIKEQLQVPENNSLSIEIKCKNYMTTEMVTLYANNSLRATTL